MARDPASLATQPAAIGPSMDVTPKATRPSEETSTFYDRLMSLTLRHDFFGGDLFPDVSITPTIPTQSLMHNLGLIVRPRRAGIDILYHTSREAGIVKYLKDHRERRQNAKQTPGPHKPSTFGGCWSRLTFALSVENDLFTNFTALPPARPPHGVLPGEMKPGEHALYLSNRYSTRAGGLPTRLIADLPDHVMSVPMVTFAPTNLHIGMPRDAITFALYDTSGRVVLLADPDYRRDDKVVEIPPRAFLKPNADLHISMENEWPGFFYYEITTQDGKNIETRETHTTEIYYSGLRTAPLLFADLFLASPDEPPAPDGTYPIDLDLPEDATAHEAITARDYEVRFKARKTTWTYYIVLSSGEAAAKGLTIQAEPNDRKDSIEFNEREDVTLPTGVPAYRFTAKNPAALSHRSDITLRLHGGGVPGNGSRILLDRLPTPSAERVGEGGASEVFVYL